MSGLKLNGLGSFSALALCALAVSCLPAALAFDPAGPMLIGATSEPIAAPAPATDADAADDNVREARRLLIDLPGTDPLSAKTNALLLFGGGADSDDDQQAIEIDRIEGDQFEVDQVEIDEVDVDAIETTPAQQASPSESSQPAAGKAKRTAAELSPEMLRLCDKIRTVLAKYYPRHQNARDNSAWEVMHAIIAYGVNTKIYRDGPGSETANAIGYMCYNYPCRGQRMLFVNRGRVDASRGVGVQGHGGQFLAILAQSHVMHDYPMLVEGKKFTLDDLVAREQQSCVTGEELTFKLIALSHYLDSDATWKTPDGQEWSIQRLIREELRQPIRGAACGGTHRLMGFSYALHKRRQQAKPIEGEFQRAQTFIRDYHRYTFSLQNSDGSFSTAWFERKATDPSIDRRLRTSGHILEWITFSLSDDELRDPRMVKAVDYVATLLAANDNHTWEIGPLGHGLHSLLLYEDRMFKDVVPMKSSPLAEDQGEAAAMPLEARRGGSR